MTIFVTGGTGFLGKRLVRHLLSQGHAVRCLARPASDTDAFREAVAVPSCNQLEIVHGSLSRVDDCLDSLRGCDVVIHAAAAMGGGAAVLFLNNVVATRQLVALALDARVKRLVLVSSLGVYGTSHLKRGDWLDESCPLDPNPHLRDAYSYSKIAQEQVAWEAYEESKLPLVVVRPSVIYGPGRGCLSTRIGLQLGNLMVRMGGKQQLPYTFVDNCAAAIALAATMPAIEGEAFNVVDDDLLTARFVLSQYRKEVQRLRVLPLPYWAISPVSGLSEWYHRRSQGQLPAILTRYKSGAQWKPLRYSNTKAKTVLGWVSKTSFAEGLAQSFGWMRKQVGTQTTKA